MLKSVDLAVPSRVVLASHCGQRVSVGGLALRGPRTNDARRSARPIIAGFPTSSGWPKHADRTRSQRSPAAIRHRSSTDRPPAGVAPMSPLSCQRRPKFEHFRHLKIKHLGWCRGLGVRLAAASHAWHRCLGIAFAVIPLGRRSGFGRVDSICTRSIVGDNQRTRVAALGRQEPASRCWGTSTADRDQRRGLVQQLELPRVRQAGTVVESQHDRAVTEDPQQQADACPRTRDEIVATDGRAAVVDQRDQPGSVVWWELEPGFVHRGADRVLRCHLVEVDRVVFGDTEAG